MIPIAKPFLGIEEAKAAQEVILSGWVTQGPRVKLFEESFAQVVGARFACAVSSCTTALHLALLAAGVKPGDVVITVSHSFIATANAVRCCGAEPVFVDIAPDTYNIDPEEILNVLREGCVERDGSFYYRDVKRIAVGESPLKQFFPHNSATPPSVGKVSAILPVHQMGMPFDISRIISIAKQCRIPVVEDAACAIGSEVSFDRGVTWEKVGKPHGDISCFSFHPRKILTTGDGGMITTNNQELDSKFRLLRQHGMSVPDMVRHESQKVFFEDYVVTGFNYRMTDIQAAVGIEQLKKLDDIITERHNIAAIYKKLLQGMPHIKLPHEDDNFHSNWQSYPIKFPDAAFSQKDIMQRLLDRGISARRGIMNAHQESPYEAAQWFLPQSEACRDQTILLPLYNGIGEKNLCYITDTLGEILTRIY